MDGIATNILYIAGICGGLVTIGGFVAKMTKPHTDLKDRVEKLERVVNANHIQLNKDFESFKQQETVNSILLEGMSHLLKHGVDGNHTKQMAACADKIDHYMLEKGASLK